LLAGEEITDELYVKLFVTKLRIQYECKDAETLKKEIMKDAKTKISKKNHDEVGFKKEQGWVLVDFPCTYAQAKLLEKALSGYEPEEDLEFTNRQKLINDATLLV
jgi:adenylate kinase family enzyme